MKFYEILKMIKIYKKNRTANRNRRIKCMNGKESAVGNNDQL